MCIVALGSVLVGRLEPARSLIGGNPAVVLRPLKERDLYLVCRKTRTDIPDDLVRTDLPNDLWDLVVRPPQAGEPAGEEEAEGAY